MMDLDTVTQIARWLFLALGVGVIVWALILRDRSKGRRRCPKCWYDMTATEGMTCPECGRTQKRERRFFGRRRSWRGVLAGAALLLLAYASDVASEVRQGGWMFAIPRSALVLVSPAIETPTLFEKEQFLAQRGSGIMQYTPGLDQPDAMQRLWLHLVCERLTSADPVPWWQYQILRRDIPRRLRPPSKHWWLSQRFLAGGCAERVFRDEELLAEMFRWSLKKTRWTASECRYVFSPRNVAFMPYSVWMNGVKVVDLFPDQSGLAANEDLSFEVPLEGEGRGRVRVVMRLSLRMNDSTSYDLPETIEFEFQAEE